MQCNLQMGDSGLAIPNSHDMNSIYLYSQYPDIRKDIDDYLEKKYDSKSAYNNNDIDDGLYANFFNIDDLEQLDLVKAALKKIKISGNLDCNISFF